MAASFKGFSSCFLLLIITLFFSIQFSTVISAQFEVGGNEGWVVPLSKNHDLYNDWASKNRFTVNNTLHFKYEKDSVLEVTQEDYEKCRAAYPLFFSNNGDTVYTLDRPGLFYFISGVSGHCERGLKMIIKVLEIETPHQSANQTASAAAPSAKLAAASGVVSSSFVTMVIIFPLFLGAI